ncbi:MAG: response regulator transcription factor [Saprospiraceae bacterium]
MIKCIIVEDDHNHSEHLLSLLKHFDSVVQVESVCADIESAAKAVETLHPRLLFLDIQIQGDKGGGFELLKRLKHHPLDVIFTTAFVDDNIEAIRLSGIDYLHKPYVLEELQDALDKFLFATAMGWDDHKTRLLRSNLLTEDISHKTVWVADGNTYDQILVGSIVYCESDNQYTIFHVKKKKGEMVKYVSSTGIGRWEKDLRKYHFCRIHRRYLVSIKDIVKYIKGEGGMVILTTGEHLDVSRSGKAELLRMAHIR